MVVPFINVGSEAVTVTLDVPGIGSDGATRNEYHFTAQALDAVSMQLNGKTLTSYDEDFSPIAKPVSDAFTVAPYSFGFVHVVGAQPPACTAGAR